MKNVAVKTVENDEALLCKRGLNFLYPYTGLKRANSTHLILEQVLTKRTRIN